MEQRTEEKQHGRRKRIMFWIVVLFLAALVALVGFILNAIRVLNGGRQTPMAAELRKLNRAMDAFQTKFMVSYVPSRIKLCKFTCQYDATNPLDRDSLAYLNQLWPRLQWVTRNADRQMLYRRIDWDGIDGPGPAELILKEGEPPPQEPTPVVLEGDQCLVFFLGGIPETINGVPGFAGFSVNPTNPAAKTQERITPFYYFKSSRLVRWHGNPFYSYLDPYGKRPFAYFSSYGRRNGYNKYFSVFGNSDCARLGVWPYAHSLGQSSQYVNPDGFQIISAGADETFGPGSVLPNGKPWSPTTAKEIDPAGRDDQGNFHALLLGVPAD